MEAPTHHPRAKLLAGHVSLLRKPLRYDYEFSCTCYSGEAELVSHGGVQCPCGAPVEPVLVEWRVSVLVALVVCEDVKIVSL